MTWRAARSLLVLHQQLQAGAPRARPPAIEVDAWGLIGDAAHDPTSDHTPHDFPGWGSQIVTAADFPNAPALGLDAHAVLNDLRLSKDPRIKYGISNGQIFSSYATSGYPAWVWRPYNPSNGDKHFTHGHLSVVGDARADDTRPWDTIGAPRAAAAEGEADMGGYGPVVMRADEQALTLTVPPVGGTPAAPGPAAVWLNFGQDVFNDGPVKWRVWLGPGDGSVRPAVGDTGELTLGSMRVASIPLPAGTRLVSVSRVDQTSPRPVVFTYELA